MESTFTVHFDGTFWIGVLDIVEGGEIRAARWVFGSEPTTAELWEFTCAQGNRLIDEALRAPGVPLAERPPSVVRNPKRLARQAARQQEEPRASRSQEALAAALEAFGKQRAMSKRDRRLANAESRSAAIVARRKAKHRGR